MTPEIDTQGGYGGRTGLVIALLLLLPGFLLPLVLFRDRPTTLKRHEELAFYASLIARAAIDPDDSHGLPVYDAEGDFEPLEGAARSLAELGYDPARPGQPPIGWKHDGLETATLRLIPESRFGIDLFVVQTPPELGPARAGGMARFGTVHVAALPASVEVGSCICLVGEDSAAIARAVEQLAPAPDRRGL